MRTTGSASTASRPLMLPVAIDASAAIGTGSSMVALGQAMRTTRKPSIATITAIEAQNMRTWRASCGSRPCGGGPATAAARPAPAWWRPVGAVVAPFSALPGAGALAR